MDLFESHRAQLERLLNIATERLSHDELGQVRTAVERWRSEGLRPAATVPKLAARDDAVLRVVEELNVADGALPPEQVDELFALAYERLPAF